MFLFSCNITFFSIQNTKHKHIHPCVCFIHSKFFLLSHSLFFNFFFLYLLVFCLSSSFSSSARTLHSHLSWIFYFLFSDVSFTFCTLPETGMFGAPVSRFFSLSRYFNSFFSFLSLSMASPTQRNNLYLFLHHHLSLSLSLSLFIFSSFLSLVHSHSHWHLSFPDSL